MICVDVVSSRELMVQLTVCGTPPFFFGGGGGRGRESSLTIEETCGFYPLMLSRSVCVAGPGSTTDQSDDEAFTPTEQQVNRRLPVPHPPSHLSSEHLTLKSRLIWSGSHSLRVPALCPFTP